MLGVVTLASAFWWTVKVVAMMGLAYLGGRLLAPDEPEVDEGEGAAGTRDRLWHPITTQQEGIPRPRAYGKNLHHGNILFKWTDVANNREILHLLIDHGDGPTKGVGDLTTDVFLNDQSASNLTSVELQQRLGTMNQTCMTGFEKPKLEYKINTEMVYGEDPIVFTTPNDFFDDIEYTIMFPNGIKYQHKSGGLAALSVPFKVRIREVGGAYTIIYNSSITTYSGSALFYKFTVSDYYGVERGKQYELEFTALQGTADRLVNAIVIRSIREVIDVEFTKPGRAMIGIRAVATARLSGRLDVKVIREDRIINVWNGTTWTLEYSNNRSMVAWDLATLPAIVGDGDGIPYEIVRYDGIDPAYLDLDFFYAWAQFCGEDSILDGYGGTEQRCACNIIVDAFTDIFTLVSKIAAVGRAHTYWKGHHFTGWIDDVVTTPIDLVTMDSMMHKTWKNYWAIEKELAGVIEVFYEDEKIGYERTKADFPSAAAGGFRNIVSLEGYGIKTRGAAIHYANYLLERNHLIRNKNNFRIHKDAFRYKLGNTIRLQCKIANWGKAFRVVSSTADTITVDRDASEEVSATDALHIRTYDTITEQVVTDSYVVDSVVGKVITVTENWDVTPVKGNLVATGITKLRRIIKMTPTINNYFDVEVETYDVILFDADDIDPDNPNANYIWPGALVSISDPISKTEVQDLIKQWLPAQPNIETPHLSNITWDDDTPEANHVSWSATDEDDDITFTYEGVTYKIDPGSTDDEFIYWSPGATTVLSTTNLVTTAIAKGNWYMCRNLEGVAYPTNSMMIAQIGVLLAGFCG